MKSDDHVFLLLFCSEFCGLQNLLLCPRIPSEWNRHVYSNDGTFEKFLEMGRQWSDDNNLDRRRSLDDDLFLFFS